MRKLLWVGDAACDTGFARSTHYTLEGLRDHFEVSVLGLNYRGDPHRWPYDIYPAYVPGGDLFGITRLSEVIRKVRPQLVVIQNDPWNIPAYVSRIKEIVDVPQPLLVGAIAIDGKNCRGTALNGLDHAIFWTEFGRYEAERGGYEGTSDVIPLGVDGAIYHPGINPGNRAAARKAIGLPDALANAFIVGNVNRNQPRKRLDLTIQAFAEWQQEHRRDDAYLFLYVAPTGDLGYDCQQLAGYHGLLNPLRLILAEPKVWQGASESHLANVYRAFNVQVNTGVGEGWGLTTLEGMACGVPQIVGNWAALGEWAAPAAMLVSTQPVASLNKVNVIGGAPCVAEIKSALEALYTNHTLYTEVRDRGLTLAADPRYNWVSIGQRFLASLQRVMEDA